MISLRRRNKLDEEFPVCETKKIHDSIFKAIEPALDAFLLKHGGNVEPVWNNINSMIYHIDSRVNYWENRRTQFLQIATALFAASIAGIIALLPQALSNGSVCTLQAILYRPMVAASAIVLLGSIYLIWQWNAQNNPNYPFTKAYEVWRWQYRGAERKGIDTKLLYRNMDEYTRQVNVFAENLKWYKKNTLECTYKELIDQDLSQLFLLITNEKFKIKYVNKLRNVLFNTIFLALIALIITVIAGLFSLGIL